MSIGRVPGATGIQPSIVTAKGDLIVATASGSVINQAVGTNNQVLMADSAQADGVKWANEATSTLTTTGDILYASAANTLARRAIGSTGDVLTVSGGLPTWAAPSSGGMTLISTTSLSGASVVLSSIPATYNNLMLVVFGMTANTSNKLFRLLPNNSTTLGIYSGLESTTGFQFNGSPLYMSGNSSTTRTSAVNAWAITINNYASTSSLKPFEVYGMYVNSSAANAQISFQGIINTTSAISSLVFDYEGTNTFAGGTVLLYGVK